MKSSSTIHWFRQDLRLSDNPAFTVACGAGNVLPIYILDDDNAGPYCMGSASRWWLHQSLNSLSLALGGKLYVFRGNPLEIIPGLVNATEAKMVCWNRCYEPWRIARDTALKAQLERSGIEVQSRNGSLLWEPWDIKKGDGTPYKVFTPFYRRGCLSASSPRVPLPAPAVVTTWSGDNHLDDLSIDDLGLLPTKNWHHQIAEHWTPGEAGAGQKLKQFIGSGLAGYKEGRNFPARPNTSRLSAHLHWGEISPNQAWHSVLDRIETVGLEADADSFLSELGWREFSYSLLFHWPDLPRKNLQPKFDHFPWVQNADYLRRWRRGQTGYPIVDAAMRELRQTGYMHNRLRMVVGSFLVKNLRLHWQNGEEWFWDCLVDADLASNSASWQWIAGCGADAAPYFRVFNPVTQGQKFDPDGSFTKRYLPELAALPTKYLFNPWEAPTQILVKAGVELGANYPHPIVDVKRSREAALSAFASLKQIP